MMRHIRIQEGTVNRFTKIILKLFKHSYVISFKTTFLFKFYNFPLIFFYLMKAPTRCANCE